MVLKFGKKSKQIPISIRVAPSISANLKEKHPKRSPLERIDGRHYCVIHTLNQYTAYKARDSRAQNPIIDILRVKHSFQHFGSCQCLFLAVF